MKIQTEQRKLHENIRSGNPHNFLWDLYWQDDFTEKKGHSDRPDRERKTEE